MPTVITLSALMKTDRVIDIIYFIHGFGTVVVSCRIDPRTCPVSHGIHIIAQTRWRVDLTFSCLS